MDYSLDDFVDYIDVPVETLWQEKVAVRDRYINEATEKQKALVLIHDGEKMRIPFEQIRKRILFKSKKPLRDKFSRNEYWLYYFPWRPNGGHRKSTEPIAKPKPIINPQKSLFE